MIAALAINTPHYARNLRFSGSPFGYGSPYGGTAFSFANSEFGIRPLFSNLIRNASLHLLFPHGRGLVYRAVVGAHALAGLDASAPSTTWTRTKYELPLPAADRHEAYGSNSWHFVLLMITGIAIFRSRGAGNIVLLR